MPDLSPLAWVLLCVVAFISGAVNALAGGGTFLTFPSLLLAGLDPIRANATSTIVLVPGGVTSAWVYRHSSPLKGSPLRAIFAVCLVGGAIGSQLLLSTSSRRFSALAPYLMLAAAIVFSFSKQAARFASKHTGGKLHLGALLAVQFFISIYGGYFGAGMGVLMIVLFQLTAQLDVQQSAGLRMMCAFFINLLAVANFVARGIPEWRVALPMIVFAIAGGYAGAFAVKRLSADLARRLVLAYAWLTGIYLLLRN